MKVQIGRTSGPCTDVVVQCNFAGQDIEIIKDTLAMVNKVSGNKEGWFLKVGENGTQITIPECK